MHRYISKIVVFFIPLVILFYSEPVYLLIDSKYKGIVAGKEIYLSIKKSKQKSKNDLKKLLQIRERSSVTNKGFHFVFV